jgi:hypothetical protein
MEMLLIDIQHQVYTRVIYVSAYNLDRFIFSIF